MILCRSAEENTLQKAADRNVAVLRERGIERCGLGAEAMLVVVHPGSDHGRLH